MNSEKLKHAMIRASVTVGLEADYWNAAVRILKNCPEKVKKSKGAPTLSQSKVAEEAGHSRTPISGENAEFPDLRDFTRRSPAMGNGGDSGSEASAMVALSQRIRKLTAERDDFATRLVEAENLVRIKDDELKRVRGR